MSSRCHCAIFVLLRGGSRKRPSLSTFGGLENLIMWRQCKVRAPITRDREVTSSHLLEAPRHDATWHDNTFVIHVYTLPFHLCHTDMLPSKLPSLFDFSLRRIFRYLCR